MSRARRALVGVCTALFVAASSLVPGASAPVSADDAGSDSATAAFAPVQPCRLADTRGGGTGFTRLDAATVRISVAGHCGVPATATAATLTVTITEPTAAGFATVYPAGSTRPLTTSGNVRAGETRATSTIARLGAGGSVDVFLSVDGHVVVDVTGGFVPTTAASSGRFVPFGPIRLADTRTRTPVPTGGNIAIALAGLPPDATAVAVNVTITETSGAGFATAFPVGATLPPTSTVNSDAPGQTRSSTVIVAVSPAGLAVHASSATHMVVDIFGYFTGPSAPDSSEGLFTAIDPQRVLDTRESSVLGAGIPLYPGGGLELALPGTSAIAAYMVAAVDAAPGFLTAYPAGRPRPATASATMSRPGDTVANLAFTQRSTRGLGFHSHGTTHLVVDLAGWFSGVTLTAEMPTPANVRPLVEYLDRGSSGCTAHVPIAKPKPDAQLLGHSVQGRPIIAEHYGDPGGTPVLVAGPPHGDECSAVAVVEKVRAEARLGMVPPGVHLVVIPSLNPDGLVAGTRRNANGIDLNKDGQAVSQPETRALMTITAQLRPRATVHLHSPLAMVAGQGGPFGLGDFMAKHIADRTGIHHAFNAGFYGSFLWEAQERIEPLMATVLVETPRGYPGEAIGATGPVKPGAVPSEELWQRTAEALIDSFRLV